MQTIALILNQLPWLVAAIALLVIRRAIGNGAATIQPTVIALNMISSPILALVVMVLGCIFAVVSKVYGLDGNTAAGIVGAGIGLLTGQVLSSTRNASSDGHPSQTEQNAGAPAAGATAPNK